MKCSSWCNGFPDWYFSYFYGFSPPKGFTKSVLQKSMASGGIKRQWRVHLNALGEEAVNSCPSLWGGSRRRKKRCFFCLLKRPRLCKSLRQALAWVFMVWTCSSRIKQACGWNAGPSGLELVGTNGSGWLFGCWNPRLLHVNDVGWVKKDVFTFKCFMCTFVRTTSKPLSSSHLCTVCRCDVNTFQRLHKFNTSKRNQDARAP